MAPKPPGRRTANNTSKKHQKVTQVASASAASASSPDVTIHSSRDEQTPLLLILRFDKAAQQHAALARIEAYYEAASPPSEKAGDDEDRRMRYLPLKEAADERICRNYEGFNFPVSALLDWLQAMRDALGPAQAHADGGIERAPASEAELEIEASPTPFWLNHCNEWEVALLRHMASVGVAIPGLEGGPELSPTSLEANDTEHLRLLSAHSKLATPPAPTVGDLSAPRYIISTLSSTSALSTVLAHEKQHALFFLNPQYAEMCRARFPVDAKLIEAACGKGAAAGHALPRVPSASPGLPPLHTPAISRRIAYELFMRSYAPHVWADEWQAYLSVPEKLLDEREFGNKAREEVREVAAFLRRESERAWRDVRTDRGEGTS